jgi:quinol monooxygenase YgiN
MTVTTSKKIAYFWRGVVRPDRLDEVIAIFEEITHNLDRPGTELDEPRTEIYAYHLEEPNTVWLYGLFDDRDALEEHRRNVHTEPFYHDFRELFSDFGATYETTPLFAKGIATGA